MTRIFKALALAEELNATTKARVAALPHAPRLVVLWREGDPAMAAYGARLKASAEGLGIAADFRPYASGREGLVAQFDAIKAESLDGIIPLYPLPPEVTPLEIASWIGPDRDLEGLHPINAGLLAGGVQGALAPATARACLRILQHLLGYLKGREVCLVGASRLVGRPLAQLLLDAEASVTLCHAATKDLGAHLRRAEVVVTAAGVAGLIKGADLAEGAVVIDVSILRGPDGLQGDLDQASAMGRASVISHVPDGVGPMTTACLFEALLDQIEGLIPRG